MFYDKTSQIIKKRLLNIHNLLLTIIIFFSFFSCSKKEPEYAVIIYSKNDTTITAGSIAQVTGKTTIRGNNIYKEDKTIVTIKHDDTNYDIPEKNLLFFKSIENAQTFVKKYEKYRKAFGVSDVNGLHVRDRPETYSQIIHRLRKGEPVKIISRSEKMDEADGEKDYWYFIQTTEGIRGYCFGYYIDIKELDLWSEKEKKDIEHERAKPAYPLLDNVLEATWHPYFVYEQVKDGDFDPDIAKKNFGLFFNKKQQMISIKMPGIDIDTHYYKIKKKDYNTYAFWDSGVVVTRIDDHNIKVSFNHNGNIIKQRYVKLSVPIKEIVERIEKRQREKLQSLIKHSRFFASDSYGEFTLYEDGTFLWKTTPLLQSYILPIDANIIEGSIDFTVNIGSTIERTYDGAFTLQITNQDFNNDIFFLYKIMDEGLQITYVPADEVTFNKINDIPLSPLIIFFKYKSEKKPDTNADITKL